MTSQIYAKDGVAGYFECNLEVVEEPILVTVSGETVDEKARVCRIAVPSEFIPDDVAVARNNLDFFVECL